MSCADACANVTSSRTTIVERLSQYSQLRTYSLIKSDSFKHVLSGIFSGLNTYVSEHLFPLLLNYTSIPAHPGYSFVMDLKDA